MGRGEGHVAQEGLALVAIDELQGLLGQDVDDVAFGRLHDAVVLERSIEVLTPVSGGVAPEGIESSGERVVGPLAAIVPLAEDPGHVARGLEGVGKGLLIEVHALLAGGDAINSESAMVASSQELGAGRGADRLHEEAIEVRAALGERIDIWRRELAITVEGIITPAGIIGEHDDHIGLRRRGQPRDDEEQAGE